MRSFFQNRPFLLAIIRDFYALFDEHHRQGAAGTVEALFVHRADLGVRTHFTTDDERFPPFDTAPSPHPPHEGFRRAKVGFRPVRP
jgi:hypothetical protein